MEIIIHKIKIKYHEIKKNTTTNQDSNGLGQWMSLDMT